MDLKQYVKFTHVEEGEKPQTFLYRQGKEGVIGLEKLSDDLTILRVYFRSLVPVDSSREFEDGETQLMLTNYPVSFKSLEELHGQTIEIKNGWLKDVLFTMLSINDGEPVNDNKISFRVNADKTVTVDWTGTYTDYGSREGSRFELHMIAFRQDGIITSLCEEDAVLRALFGKCSLEEVSKHPHPDLTDEEEDE
jgi:hypothetical protein